MRIQTRHIFCFFLLLLWKPGDVHCRWVSRFKVQTEQEARIQVQAVTNDRMIIEITIPGFYLEQDSLLPAFNTVRIPGCELSVEPNLPQLPVLNRLLVVPEGRQAVIERLEITDHIYNMQDLGTINPLKPAPVSVRVGGASPQLAADRSASYNADQYYPDEPVRILPGGVMRGRRLARLQIMPLQYNPMRREIRMLSRLECTIKIIDAAPARQDVEQQAGYLSLFDRILEGDGIVSTQQTGGAFTIPEPPGYLIITPDGFTGQAERLAEWKAQKGYRVQIAALSETGSGAVEIQNYIRQVYRSWATPPEFVVLAGDITHIPAFTGQFALNPHVPHVTDLYYSTMDGADDIFPDLMVGRLPAADTSQLRIMIDKIIAYEKLVDPDYSWLNHASFIATKDVNFHKFVEKGHRNSINKYFSPHVIQADSIWTFYDNNRQQLTDAINRGTSLVVYSGHGSEVYWNDLDSWSLVDLYYLQNTEHYPVTLSFGCNAGAFDYKSSIMMECLGETFLSYEQRGAVLFWGATDLSFWHQDYFLQEQFLHAAFDKEFESIGQMTVDALLQLYTRGYSYSDFYMEVYNILGDPSLPLWRGAPKVLSVQHPQTLAAGTEQVDIFVTGINGSLDGALAAVSQNGLLLGATLSQNGNAVIALNAPVSGNTALLTVSKAQHIIYQAQLTVPTPPLVKFTPDTLLANTEQTLHVQVNSASGAPLANYQIIIEGTRLDSRVHAFTNAAGLADMQIKSPYGQLLKVYGKTQTDTTPDFAGRLEVKSTYGFTDVRIYASAPLIQLDSTLAPGIPGEITVTAQPMPDKIFVNGCGIDTVLSTGDFTLVPQCYGKISVSLGATGYQLYQTEITVCDAVAQVAGLVLQKTDSLALANAYINMEHVQSKVDYHTESDNSGVFAITDIPAGFYYMTVYKKGFLVYTDSIWVTAGQNTLPVYLQASQLGIVSGTVTLSAADDYSGTIVRIRGQGIADTTAMNGEYTLPGVIPDTVVISAQHDGYSSASREIILAEGTGVGNVDFVLIPGISLVNESFEQDAGEFTCSGLWQWGVPQPGMYYRAPDKAHSGRRVWGTVLDGDYAPFADYKLDSPDISLVGHVEPVVQFYHYYCMDYLNTGYDGGNVKLSADDGLTWTIIHPQGGYPCDSLAAENIALAGQPGFSGCIDSWQHVKFDLRAWANRHIRLRFHFGSTGQAEDAGWYIDDFSVFDSSTVQIQNGKDGQPVSYVLWQNFPNPFNAETIIGYELPENSYVQLLIFNTLGQKVKTLTAEFFKPGRYHVRWQGTDDNGQQVSAGIYLVQLIAGKYSETKKIALLR